MDRGAWQATVHGVARVGHHLASKQPIIKAYIFTFTVIISRVPKQKKM